jgi:hypothetical protein
MLASGVLWSVHQQKLQHGNNREVNDTERLMVETLSRQM